MLVIELIVKNWATKMLVFILLCPLHALTTFLVDRRTYSGDQCFKSDSVYLVPRANGSPTPMATLKHHLSWRLIVVVGSCCSADKRA